MAAHDKNRRWALLGRLRTAVKKVTFLMNFNMNRWRLTSSFIGGGRALSSRRLSFNERLGLTSIISSSSSSSDEDQSNWASPNYTEVSASSSSSQQISPEQGDLHKTRSFPLQRTTSFPEEDDIDRRAEMFITNFRKKLQMERQVSLQLRYRRDASFGSYNTISP